MVLPHILTMDPNKALAIVLGSLGCILFLGMLGLAGLVPFFESLSENKTMETNTSPASPPKSSLPSPPISTPTPPASTPPQPIPPPVPLSEPQKFNPPSIPPNQPSTPPPVSSRPSQLASQLEPQPSSPPRRGLAETGYYTFDKASPGALPTGWTIIRGNWQAELEPYAMPGTGKNILHQFDVPKEHDDAIVLSNDTVMKNVEASTFLRVSNTRINQTAGVVFRFQDPDHYYSVGLDTLNQRVVLFKTVAGQTRVLYFASTNRIRANEWNLLHIAATGEHLKVQLNDDNYISLKDTTYNEGKTGLWTMGSTDARFDNADFKKLP